MGLVQVEQATCASLTSHFGTNYSDGCGVDFDRSLCWQPAKFGEVAERSCPFTYCPEVPGCEELAKSLVLRTCLTTGWNKTDYGQCINIIKDHRECIVGFCNRCPDTMRDIVIAVSLTLSVISVVLLLAAIILFSIFDSIQCRRLSIHKNLAVAFVFRFIFLGIWTVTQNSAAFNDCNLYSGYMHHLEWLCKSILWCVIYFQVASVMWMLIEGAYLYSRFTVFAMRHSDAPYALYMFCGWGVPAIVVMAWTIIHHFKMQNVADGFCWLPYAQGPHLWILAGTMGLALILNLVFLLLIVAILVQKLRTENTAESKKIWRTIKATLLLVPLLGISNIPLFYEPENRTAFYMLGSAILQHSQGIFIAVLYCFLNSEVQNAIKRHTKFSKLPIANYFVGRRQRFETERTYVPPDNQSTATNHKLEPIPEHSQESQSTPKLGVPMAELNGTAADKSPSKDSMSNGTSAKLEPIREKDDAGSQEFS